MAQAISRQLKMSRQKLDYLKNKRVLQSPLNYIQDRRLLVNHQQKQLHNGMRHILSEQKRALIRLAAGLDAMSPLKVLARGYSMTRDEKGRVITSSDAVRAGDLLRITLANGRINAAVITAEGETYGE